jgi:hypothetical protein
MVYDFKYQAFFFILMIVIGVISLNDGVSKYEMQIYGEKEDKKKYNEGDFKVFNDYLIQEPSEYGKKETSNEINP